MRIKLNGADLAYEDEGRGLPVVLIHGFPFSRQMWRPQVTALARHHRVVTPDLRGFGESSGTLSTVEELAEDVHALVRYLELPPFVLGGFSMGGYVAFRYLARYAEQVKAVLLLDTRAEADSPEARERRCAGIERVQKEGPDGFLDDFLKLVVAPRTVESRPEIVTEVRRLMQGTKVAAVAGGLQAMAYRPDSTTLLATIRVPTLIVVGEEDKATPVDSSRKMQAAIAGADLVIIPQAGHVANLEQPERFNAALLDFLAKIR